MNCINCGSNDFNTFFNETMACSHCNEVNNISYHACRSCGLIWKSIDNKIVEEVMFMDPDLGHVLDDCTQKFTFSTDEAPKTSMKDVIHKCLRCGTTSFEIGPKLYHCPDCSFEWEVI